MCPGWTSPACRRGFVTPIPTWPPDELRAEVIAGGRSNLTYAVDGARIPLVLRRPPLGHVLSSAHDMRREHRVISRAAAARAVPVPRGRRPRRRHRRRQGHRHAVLRHGARARHGARPGPRRTPRSHAAGLRALSVELVEHLADLHAVDPAAVGLADFGRPDGLPRPPAVDLAPPARRLALPRAPGARRAAGHASRERVPDQPRDPASCTATTGSTTRSSSATATSRTSRRSSTGRWRPSATRSSTSASSRLYWDIARAAGRFAGVVPSAVDPAAGYPSFDELVEAYAARAGIAIPDLGWYRAFAAYKLAVILEGIHFRYQRRRDRRRRLRRMGALVEPLAAAGLAPAAGLETLMDFAPDARTARADRAGARVPRRARGARRARARRAARRRARGVGPAADRPRPAGDGPGRRGCGTCSCPASAAPG